MTQEHPITPPPKLMQQWAAEYWGDARELLAPSERYIATQAARWGADEQLQMDANWVTLQMSNKMSAERLIAEMRPKPLSLKEQAIEILDDIETQLDAVHYNILRRALETLSD